MINKIVVFLMGWKALIFFFAFIASFTFPVNVSFIPWERLNYPYLIYVWGNFDGIHYLSIAKSGYFTYQQAFFPLYPLVIRIVAEIINYKYLISGLLISHLAFISALFVAWKLIVLDNHKKLFIFLLLIVLTFPSSFFYGAIYNDSLFFFLATYCIYLGRKKKWVLGSVIGALATLTRLNGLALFLFLLFEYLYSDRVAPRSKKQLLSFIKKAMLSVKIKQFFSNRVYTIFFIPLSFLGYLLYTHLAQGNWNMVFSSMKIWNQDELTFPLQVVWRYLKIIFIDRSFSITYWVAIVEFLFVVLYVLICVYSYSRLRFSYWFFMFLSFLIPSLTGTFAGMPRYGLHIYPFFLSLALFLSDKFFSIKLLYIFISLMFMFIFIMFFTRGYFIS